MTRWPILEGGPRHGISFVCIEWVGSWFLESSGGGDRGGLWISLSLMIFLSGVFCGVLFSTAFCGCPISFQCSLPLLFFFLSATPFPLVFLFVPSFLFLPFGISFHVHFPRYFSSSFLHPPQFIARPGVFLVEHTLQSHQFLFNPPRSLSQSQAESTFITTTHHTLEHTSPIRVGSYFKTENHNSIMAFSIPFISSFFY